MIKKTSFLFLILLNVNFYGFGSLCAPDFNDEQTNSKDLLNNFKPDFHIKEQIEKDCEVLETMRDLFFEPDPVLAAKISQDGNLMSSSSRDVYEKAIDKYGAKEEILRTKDGFRLDSLYFKNPNALFNIIYVTGYFGNETPTGTWATPFWGLHNKEVKDSEVLPLNMLVFDWRSFGFSEGCDGLLKKDFGTNAYLDIQAAVDFIRKDNDKPIILVGFCAGAAMIMKATIEAQKKGDNIADALVLNSIFTTFERQFNRASGAANQLVQKILLKSGVASFYLDLTLNGSLFDLNPIEMIEEIKIPCLFEHYTDDPFAVLEDAIPVYNKAKEKNIFTMFLQSDMGRHVRIHSKVPFQYRQAFYSFLKESKLISSNELLTLE